MALEIMPDHVHVLVEGGRRWQSSNHMSKIRRTYKYRLWPNRKQREVLFSTLEVCRQLYNDALKERREAWKLCRAMRIFLHAIGAVARLQGSRPCAGQGVFAGAARCAAPCR